MANIIGTNSNNTLNGTTSADTIIGRAGNDTLNGSGGNDRLNGGTGTDILNGGTGIDTADYSNLVINGTTYIGATAGVTVNLGLTGAQNTGGAGTDTLTSMENVIGTNFADRLTGNSANNVLSGLAGNDTLVGGSGNDQLNGGSGNDRVDGGTGIDTADYSTATAAVTVNLGNIGAQNTGGAGSDTLVSIENLIGSNVADNLFGNTGNNVLIGLSGNDQLYGDTGDDRLSGGAGDDSLDGGLGLDTADYSTATAAVTVNLGVTNYQNTGGAGTDLVVDIENLLGSNFNDVLTGNTGANVLTGGAGNDTLDGGVGADVMQGGTGNDIYHVDTPGDAVVEATDDAAGGRDTVYSSITSTLGFGIEQLVLAGTAAINGTGNAKNNDLFGNDAKNTLSGLEGNDAIYGQGGEDRLFGGGGDDQLAGGAGSDIVHGESGRDQLFGGSGADVLDGGAGADTMTGGLDDDEYIVDDLGDVVVETRDDLAGGADEVYSSVTHTLGFGIETLILTGTAAINGTGNTKGNPLNGNNANNVLSGLDGRDFLYGEGGADQLNGGNGDDFLNGGLGADRLSGGAGNDLFNYEGIPDSPSGTGRDTILDFTGAGAAVGDVINLQVIDANTLLAGNQAFTYIGSGAFTAAGQLRYSGGVLQGDVDGNGVADIEIQLLGSPALSVSGTGTDILL
ncbi:conserved hypothetical protein [Candidatus Nitrospira nitrosa]|uniref:Calcium-binding protein n=1 Tax=Candidatus Nitrospira nitrosa TaxID=1742972 RepID=A0A0S4LAQ2_9BACT|nr:calcium-binding protein [Candidatus Nitrospira nitrosa]CUS33712.1 conserved hypothetical protein [Candidatus Nitrospira nitrosa]